MSPSGHDKKHLIGKIGDNRYHLHQLNIPIVMYPVASSPPLHVPRIPSNSSRAPNKPPQDLALVLVIVDVRVGIAGALQQ